jgi:hypothetical protein
VPILAVCPCRPPLRTTSRSTLSSKQPCCSRPWRRAPTASADATSSTTSCISGSRRWSAWRRRLQAASGPCRLNATPSPTRSTRPTRRWSRAATSAPTRAAARPSARLRGRGAPGWRPRRCPTPAASPSPAALSNMCSSPEPAVTGHRRPVPPGQVRDCAARRLDVSGGRHPDAGRLPEQRRRDQALRQGLGRERSPRRPQPRCR